MKEVKVLRLCKVSICLALGAFGLLTGIDNFIDYDTNYQFVLHTLAMDTVFPVSSLKWRAISSPFWVEVFYGLIILGELLTGVLLLVGTIELVQSVGDGVRFSVAKRWVYLGCTLGFLLWFGGFMLVGGEWFKMWQSERWNGVESAFRFALIMLAALIFVGQPEDTAKGFGSHE